MAVSLEVPVEKTRKVGMAALQALTAAEIEAVNDVITAQMQSDVPLIPELAGHLINAGGKRMRPMLTIASAKLCGYDAGQRHVNLAAVVEFIHTATLLHDDVVDNSLLRRGFETANSLWDNKSSVLVGDFLFSRSFQLMVADGSLEVLEVLSQASATIAEGEVLQLTTTNNLETTQDQYWQVITAKTATLFAAATEVGALIADVDDKTRQNLAQYGLALGRAFQLADDILDYQSDAATFGKTIGDDFREGKVTLPLILALQQASAEQQTALKNLFSFDKEKPEAFDQALEIISQTNALEDSRQIARQESQKAIGHLQGFPASDLKTALIEAAQFSVDRLY